MSTRIFGASLILMLLCVLAEIRSVRDAPVISRSTSRNGEQFQVDAAEIFKFFSATRVPSTGQISESVGIIPRGATGTRSIIQQLMTLDSDQINEVEKCTRNDLNELHAELSLRLTPDIFGSICLEKITPEGLSAWLISPRPRIDLWTNKKVVRSLQSEIKAEIRPSGLIVDKTRGYLAAIPDALVGERAVVKVHAAQLLGEDLSNINNFIDNELSPQRYLYYEIQGLLAIMDREDCILAIVSKEFIKPVVIKRNRDFWNNKMVKKIDQLYMKTFLSGPSSDQQLNARELTTDSLRERIRALLSCNVCSEVIKPPYKVCRNGHLLCHDCWPQLQRTAMEKGELPKCPTCREPIPPRPSRCLPFESLCNLIAPDLSPDPVVRPDDPMDIAPVSRSTSRQSPQTERGRRERAVSAPPQQFPEPEWDLGRAINPTTFRHIFNPGSILRTERFVGRVASPPSPQFDSNWEQQGLRGPFGSSFSGSSPIFSRRFSVSPLQHEPIFGRPIFSPSSQIESYWGQPGSLGTSPQPFIQRRIRIIRQGPGFD